jgi:pimeloyl-ACP methyl ester carboxylesterase
VRRRKQNRWQDRRIWAAGAGLGALAAGGALQWAHMRRIASDPEQEVLRDPPRGRALTIPSADGTTLHAEVFGAEEGTTVVLAHGWTESLTYWAYVVRELSDRGLRVVAYDLRGHGDSEPAAGDDYSIERFGEDLEAVLETCLPQGQRAVVAGHSLGAMAIAAWAEHHEVEQRAGAAALMNTGVGDLIAEHLLLPLPKVAQALNKTIALRGFLGNRAPIPRFSTPLGHAALRYIAFGPDATPAQVAFIERMLVRNPPDIRAKVGMAMSELELYDALPRLTVPTVVIAGEKDRLTPPAHARKIAEMLPQLDELIVLDDTGHMAAVEQHDAISKVLAELAAGVKSSAGAVHA